MSRSLTDAVRSGNISEVHIRLNMGEDVNQADPPQYRSPLHWAVACDHLDIAELLLTRGAALDMGERDGSTPLALAKQERKSHFVDLLTKAGAKSTSSPCSSPFPQITSDPLFRDVPPWNVTDIQHYLHPVGGTTVTEGVHNTTKSDAHAPGPKTDSSSKVYSNMFKTKNKNVEEKRTEQRNESVSEVQKEKKSTVKSFVTNVITPKPNTNTKSNDQRPRSQNSLDGSFKLGEHSYLPNDEAAKNIKEEEETEVVIDKVEMEEVTKRSSYIGPLQEKCIAGKHYVTNIINTKETDLSKSFKERGASAKTYFDKIKKKSNTDDTSSFKSKGVTTTTTDEEDLRPKPQICLAESYKSNVDSNTSVKESPFMGLDEVTPDNIEIEEEPKSKGYIEPLHDKCLSAKMYMKNIKTSKHNDWPTSLKEKGASAKAYFGKLNNKSNSNGDLTKKPPNSISNYFRKKGTPVSNIKTKQGKKTENTKENKPHIHSENILKEKGSAAKEYVSNIKTKLGKKKENTNEDKPKIHNNNILKTKGTAAKEYMSNIKAKLGKKTENTNEDKPELDKENTLKVRGTAAKEYISKFFTNKPEENTKKDKTPTEKCASTGKGKFKGCMDNVLNNRKISPIAARSDQISNRHSDYSSSNFLRPKTEDLDENTTILRGRSVKDYVKMYEEKHKSSDNTNTIITGYSRPFKEFNDNNLSALPCEEAVTNIERYATVNGGEDRPASLGKQADNNTPNKKGETNLIKELKRKHFDLQQDFQNFSGRLEEGKRAGLEQFDRSWKGVRHRAKKWKIVRALQRKKENGTENEGKIYLKSGSGRSLQFYTFRKLSIN